MQYNISALSNNNQCYDLPINLSQKQTFTDLYNKTSDLNYSFKFAMNSCMLNLMIQ